jgi:hypothetical protein
VCIGLLVIQNGTGTASELSADSIKNIRIVFAGLHVPPAHLRETIGFIIQVGLARFILSFFPKENPKHKRARATTAAMHPDTRTEPTGTGNGCILDQRWP